MKKILGLDIGTNSIGWSLIERDFNNETGKILGMGSRIIPTDSDLLSKYETGQAASKNAGRRQARGARRLKYRYKLRRQRLIDAMKILGWMPETFKVGNQMPVSENLLREMQAAFGRKDISDDWVVYYLRHKALTEPIQKDELARILYHMNQRRGFKSNRKAGNEMPQEEEEENESGRGRREKKVEIVTIVSVEETAEKIKGNVLYKVELADGRYGNIARKIKPEWVNQELELEITWIPPTKKEPARYEFRKLNNTDADLWAKQKVAREEAIRRSGDQFPGNYYFQELKKNPGYIIKDISIDRQFYVDELEAILKKQIEYNPSLYDSQRMSLIAEDFYTKNLEKQKEIKNKDLLHLFINDIIYFQRPLKSKKSSIADCRLEFKDYRDRLTGKKSGIKAAPISSPVFQEFRIWQTINNIRILKRESRDINGRLQLDNDISQEYLNTSGIEKLYELFSRKEKVEQKQILKEFGLSESEYSVNLYRQNEGKLLPGNETKALIRKALKKADYQTEGEKLLNQPDKLYLFWHILYSLEESGNIKSGLQRQLQIPEEKAEIISKAPAFKQQYGSLSHKAMNKLLPLMRAGKYWSWECISEDTRERLSKIFSGEFDEGISNQVRDLFIKYNLNSEIACQGLMVPMASYAVYGVHSERNQAYFERPEQVVPKEALNLRNPIVEQVVNETLRLVQDIWKTHGRPYEIHIELARDLKKNAKERQEISKVIAENENENKRISAILRELRWGNPDSFGDIERLKLWEKQADESAKLDFQNIKFRRPGEPTKDEIQKYKLWANQKFLSPYSGKPIPISQLFTRAYDIDHIIPRSRFFDDSFENKVVVETELNKEKDNMTAFEYIKKARQKESLSLSDYENHINHYFYGKKKRLLLSEDVPDSFSNRHLVDTRYINRKLHELLGPVAENQKDPIISTSGNITSELKSSWGLGEKMKELVRWRFERLQEKTGEPYAWYVEETDQDGKAMGRRFLRLKGYEKRIDHRHHALDALIVAATTRSHIKYLNDLNAAQYRRAPTDEDLKEKLPKLLESAKAGDYLQSRKFKKPWKGFVSETMKNMEGIVVSFKKNIKLYGKKANKNIRFIEQADGTFKKEMKVVLDDIGNRKMSGYVRQSLHKATIAGKIGLREYKPVLISDAFKDCELIADKSEKFYLRNLLNSVAGDVKKALKLYKENPLKDIEGNELKRVMQIVINSYYVNRVDLSSGFDEKRIDKIPDGPIRKELLSHIKNIEMLNKNKSKDEEIAPFGSEGLEILNKERKPIITKVRIREESFSKFQIRPGAYTEADKGTNLFYVIYVNIDNAAVRQFESIPLRTVIEAKVSGSDFVEERPGFRWFTLSPQDLVYMPGEGEDMAGIDWNDTASLARNIYKMVSCNKGQAFFVPQTLSTVIVDKIEFDSTNKVERALDSRMIKQHCIKLKIDRLGKIFPAR
ncbi:type II CRISPR RNA-guided endonuclease Cas9 [Flavitalea flava]